MAGCRLLLSGLLALGILTKASAQDSASPAVPAVNAKVARAKIGLALEGGGALGLAHVGVLQWFEAHHIPIDYVAGTSMGGLVAGLYATGSSAKEITKFTDDINWNRALNNETPYRALSFRRKEDRRQYPNRLEFGLKNGVSFPL